MDTNTENEVIQPKADEPKTPVDMIKATKMILCGINALIALVYTYLSKSYNVIGVAGVIIILSLLLVRLLKSEQGASASAFLPSFILADICCIISLHWEDLKLAFKSDLFDGWHYLEGFSGACLWIALFGCCATLIGFSIAQITWLSGIGGGAVCASIILWIWSNQDIENLQFVTGGEVFLSFVIGFSVLWAFIAQFISITNPQCRSGANWIWLTLLCLFFVFAVAGVDYARIMADEWATTLVKWAGILSGWHIVILSVVLLLLAAAGLFAFSEDYLGIDCMACASFASIILATRISKAFPFTYSTLLIVALMGFTLKWVANERNQKKTFGVDHLIYYPAQFGAFVMSVILLHHGLWMTFLILIAFSIALYSMHTRSKEKYRGNVYWVLLLVGIAAFTASWLWQFRFSIETMGLLVFILALSIMALLLVSQKQPGDEKVSLGPRCVVCGIMIILCLFMMGHDGSTVDLKINDNDYAVVHMNARGRGNTINSAEAVWCDEIGSPVSEPITLANEEERLQLESSRLRVTVVDAHGVRTTRDFFVKPNLQ